MRTHGLTSVLLLLNCALAAACSSSAISRPGASSPEVAEPDAMPGALDSEAPAAAASTPAAPPSADAAARLGEADKPCWLAQPAFCETFERASPGGRGGDLDELQWAAARIRAPNPSQGIVNHWIPTVAEACGKTRRGVLPPNDMFICAGGGTKSMHFNNAYDDGGDFLVQSYRVRRPFDFTKRTGVISFDVGGKAQLPTGHGWWFNVFIASEPVPAPYQQGGAIALYVKAGVGIEFMAAPTACNDYDARRNTVSTVYIEKDYKIVRELHPPHGVECYDTRDEVMNHVEIHISKQRLEVYASDAGKPSTLRKIADFADVDLPLERGYVSFQHTHYNANKNNSACPDPQTNCPILHAYTTYHWDNIGFDGPVLPLPRAYELRDSMEPAYRGGMNVGYELGNDSAKSFALKGVDLGNATGAVLTLNAWQFYAEDAIDYRVNGGPKRRFAHPFPDSDGGARAVAIPVALSDLKPGDNTIELTSTSGHVVIANADLTINVR